MLCYGEHGEDQSLALSVMTGPVAYDLEVAVRPCVSNALEPVRSLAAFENGKFLAF